MAERNDSTSWSLEIVRGADVGRRYALRGGVTVVGNNLNGTIGLDLADQEGAAPRRMAPRQARLQCGSDSLTLADLGSPGGTFVNRERIAPFQPKPLKPGDLVQLASVQLRVVRDAPTAAGPTRPAPAGQAVGPFAFTLKSGAVCRSWDDFLTVSAQRWNELRDELTSGRLAAFLVSQGQAPLAPDPHAPGSPDERLDAWLAALPSQRTPTPELSVHPARLVIRATSRGGTTRSTLTISNAGYRLLRTTARVEPSGTDWLAIGDGLDGVTITTVERTNLPLDVRIPDELPRALSATVVLESNGGTARVAVTLEPAPKEEPIPDTAGTEPARAPSRGLAERLAGVSPRVRILAGAAAGFVGRSLIGVASVLIGPEVAERPALIGPVVLGASLGAIGGLAPVRDRRRAADLGFSLFAGAFVGLLAAVVAVMACRSVEPLLGEGAPWLLRGLLWAAIGAGLAALSLRSVPHRPADREAP